MNCGVLVFEFKEIISCGPNQINFLKLEKKKRGIKFNATRNESHLNYFYLSLAS